MTTKGVIVNASNYQFYELLNGGETPSLSPVEIEYQSENSSSRSYTDLSNSLSMDVSSPSTASMSSPSSCYPSLTIEGQLKSQIRFRYKSEKGNHGGLKPIIKLHNLESSDGIWIRTTLHTCGNNPTLHVLELDGKDCEDGVGWKELKNFTAKFSSLTICMRKKDEIAALLKKRIKQNYKEQKRRIIEKDIDKEVQEKIKTFNLNSGRLYFEAFYDKDESSPVCEGIFSSPIYNPKCTLAGELKITRLSSFSGETKGGEDMILLCDKIRKEDIEIIFSCRDLNWEERAHFNLTDVHHQVAIPFKTPRFVKNIEHEVSIRLCRKSDGKTGEPRVFLYKPCDDFDEGKPSKRKRPNPPDDDSMPMPEIQSEPCTSTTSDECIPQLPDCDELLNYIIASCSNSDTIPGIDTNQWDLPFDHVTSEGILNLASLNLCEKPLNPKINADQERTITSNCRSEVEPVQMLKSGVFNLLGGSNTFLRFLPALLSMKDENGNTLLHLVIVERSENLPLLVKMLEAAPDGLINQTNKAKMTPLHIAVTKGVWKVVRVLLMSGANPDIRDKNGNTCTHLAAMHNLPWCLGEVLTPLLGGNKKRRHLPDVNLLNYDGLAPLHLSVLKGSKICVKLLVQAKADINIPDGKCGKTPLHFAYEKNYDLVSLLRSQIGINLNAEDFNGNMPNLYVSKVQTNFRVAPKPTECCIELSTESSNSNEDDCIEIKEENCEVFEKDNIKKRHADENGEDLFCKTLDSNQLWKKLGLYIMDEKELNVIELMDTTPTKTILNELKKKHKEKYPERLKFILSDGELEEFAHLLHV